MKILSFRNTQFEFYISNYSESEITECIFIFNSLSPLLLIFIQLSNCIILIDENSIIKKSDSLACNTNWYGQNKINNLFRICD